MHPNFWRFCRSFLSVDNSLGICTASWWQFPIPPVWVVRGGGVQGRAGPRQPPSWSTKQSSAQFMLQWSSQPFSEVSRSLVWSSRVRPGTRKKPRNDYCSTPSAPRLPLLALAGCKLGFRPGCKFQSGVANRSAQCPTLTSRYLGLCNLTSAPPPQGPISLPTTQLESLQVPRARR
jgi:hypothetical protein